MFAVVPRSMQRMRWPWLGEFIAGEARAWLFVAKGLLAMLLATWLAMWLRLEQPSTCMMTVAIVMHPHSGMVLAKSFYRAIGTVTGSVFALVLMGLVPQNRELFLLALSLWVALCAGGAMLYRNFMAYGFVLAGYTAAIVTLPVANSPLDVFDSAVMRVSEVLLGIAVSGLVSDVILPERMHTTLRQNVRRQFTGFIDLVRDSAGGSISRVEMERAQLAFVRNAVQLEDLRASVIFEDPEVYARSGQMRLFNERYMAAATSFQSLHHLILRLHHAGRAEIVQALIALCEPLRDALSPARGQQHDPGVLAPRVEAFAASLRGRAMALRKGLDGDPLEFDTGASLAARFAEELHGFIAIEEALRGGPIRRYVERVRFRRSTDALGAALVALRGFVTLVPLALFWLASDWTEGGSAMIVAAIFSGLVAAMPNPVGAVVRILVGFALGACAAFVAAFWLLPGSDSFPLLATLLLPWLAIGFYLATRPTLFGIGVGYAIGFSFTLGLKNPMTYDVGYFLNNAIALLIGVLVCAVAYMVLPGVDGTRWQRARQLRRLRELVWQAASEPLAEVGPQFESVSRDLFLQQVTHTRPESRESRVLLAWGLAVQESGRVLIELREEMAGATYAPALQVAVQEAVTAVGELYREPDAGHWRRADRAVGAAIAIAARTPALRSHLYQLRSALRDEESPLASLIPDDPDKETP
ncbi:FUSC family protein [Frateuria defendens]|uniref:FUSC family protein n=1 Tax=Frateuria defendens TaxID=2219559 RepID=UPI00066FF67D|nr:FUSC family protein [Frateuria defendens]